jgi:hypothetical protein
MYSVHSIHVSVCVRACVFDTGAMTTNQVVPINPDPAVRIKVTRLVPTFSSSLLYFNSFVLTVLASHSARYGLSDHPRRRSLLPCPAATTSIHPSIVLPTPVLLLLLVVVVLLSMLAAVAVGEFHNEYCYAGGPETTHSEYFVRSQSHATIAGIATGR